MRSDDPSDDPRILTLTYTSSTTDLMSVAQLVEMIEQIRPKNERLGLTGLLLYSGGNVIQTLEGTSYAVYRVFDAIRADTRHGDVRIRRPALRGRPVLRHLVDGLPQRLGA